MASFGKVSKQRLSLCTGHIINVMYHAIQVYDFTVLSTYRGEAEQNTLYKDGFSKLKYPESSHNKKPSEGIDIAPWPIDWQDIGRFKYLAGVVMGVAHMLDVPLRWGGDWDCDGDMTDQKFMDWGHFELDLREGVK
jgi:peptidoglycan L-alanyl-D-glutamate endopeptidase CwlK